MTGSETPEPDADDAAADPDPSPVAEPDGAVPPPRGSPAGLGEIDVDRLATIGQRVLARLVDVLVIGAPVFLLILMTSDFNEDAGTVRTPLWAQLVATGVSAVYEVVLTHLRGQTVGKHALNIKVVRVTDGRPPDWTASIMRYLLPLLPALVPVPGVFLLSPIIYLVAIIDPLRRGWHDRAAGTIVVKLDRPPEAPPSPAG